ncbi:MAG: hypothetical protein R3312_08270 [Gammaproteobacteria bacterium]|nr:hypothetical protein [Gammaproteobacteria bacterium]
MAGLNQVSSGVNADEIDRGRLQKPVRLNWGALGSSVFVILVLSLLVLGWNQRTDSYIEAETGIGYGLGIVGGSMMLLLLVYPLRKRLRSLNAFLSVKFWFRLHMAFGILGPVAILYHSGFSLGSTNSNVALFCMLLVAFSGLFGRYLYIRIHHGLYGARTRVSGFQQHAQASRELLLSTIPHAERIIASFDKLEKIAAVPAHGLVHALKLRQKTRQEVALLQHEIQKLIDPDSGADIYLNDSAASLIDKHTEAYFQALKRAASLQINERLFSWWHILHLPLFIMMLLSGIVHVVVVHIY